MPAKNGATWKTNSIWPEIRETLSGQDYIIVYDLETSGLSRKNDRIIEIAAVKFAIGEGYILTEVGTYHQYINPGFPLPDKITEITGITDEMLRDMPSEDMVIDDVVEFFDGFLLSGYNIETFDNKFLNEYYGRLGIPFFTPGSVDCLKMARNLLAKGTDVESHKLSTVGDYFGLKFQAHSAIEDARTCGTLLQMFLNEYTRLDAAPTAVTVGTIQPLIQKIAFWEGFKGFSRIYVTTDAGSLYYDIRTNNWGGKDIDIREIDMAWLETRVLELVGVSSETEFSKFKGTLDIA